MDFPNEGCYKAYQCGQELILSGLAITPEILEKGLSFCDNRQEQVFFCIGMILEVSDLEEVRT